MALDRVCIELSGRKFALPLRVGTGEVNAHILHPDEIGVRFCTAVLTWVDVIPFQSEQFAAPHTCGKSEEDKLIKNFFLHLYKQPRDFFV